MQSRVCMVTGANSGIGKATSLGLAKLGATVVMVCRNREKGEAALKEISQSSRSQSVSLLVADLASQRAIRQLAKEFVDTHSKLHVLINNAGVFLMKRRLTEDGLEMTIAVNHLAPFLLTNLLLDLLKASAPSRIVTVSSAAHYGEKINFDDLQGEKHFSGFRAYGQSKLANVLFTYALAQKLEGTGVTVNCLHPGVVRTNLVRNNSGVIRVGYKIVSLFFASPRKGARGVINLASAAEVEGLTGRYFSKMREARSSEESYDDGVARRLWQLSAGLTELE